MCSAAVLPYNWYCLRLESNNGLELWRTGSRDLTCRVGPSDEPKRSQGRPWTSNPRTAIQRRLNMGFGIFVLIVTLVYTLFGCYMLKKGREADRERGSRWT